MSVNISPTELSLFLDDIHKNINNDDNTDFRKLALFLFGFTHDKLESNATNDDQLLRLITTLELVFSKKLHLLNSEITAEDTKSIPIGRNQSCLFYHWSILFALYHIPTYANDPTVLNHLKSFIINTIVLVTTKLHSFKYVKQLKAVLIQLMDSNLAFLIDKVFDSSTPRFQEVLASTVHLYSILNDYDLSNKLLLNFVAFQLKFESYARKIWFVLNEDKSNNLDSLKSVLVLNLTNNLVLNDSVTWNQISLLFNWVIEHLNSKEVYTSSRTLQRSMSYTLLKVYVLCRDKNIISNYINHNHFNNLLKSCQQASDLPITILKTLHLINYNYNLQISNQEIVNYYQTTSKNQYIIAPFNDFELDGLRIQLIDTNSHDSKTKQILQLLQFIAEEKHNIKFDTNILSSPAFNYLLWINQVKAATTQNIEEKYTLFSLITALGHFPCLVNNDYNFEVRECTKCSLVKNYNQKIDINRKSVLDVPEIKILYQHIIIKYLLGAKVKLLLNNPVLCCNFMLTLFKLFASYLPPHGNIEDDLIFKFILEQLSTNRNRDVRLLAARLIPLYLLQAKSKQVDANFKYIFKTISSIDFTSDSRKHFAESTISTLVELAIISTGEWLCVIFIKLIDLLGENNDQHVNYVYNGFISIASAKSLAPYKLLSPYFPSVAEVIIKKPRMFQRITELLGVTKKFFLSRTREYTTPRLLEYYKFDFIQEIADASNLTKFDLVAKNLPRIIATYLVKEVPINEKYIINVLSNINPKYKLVNLSNLVSRVGEITWYILLQIQIDEQERFTNEDKVLNALNYVAKISLRQKGQDVSKDSDFVEYHLGENVLELVQKFSENVHHIKGTKPFLEKVASLRAIEFLINKNIQSVTAALGQISTCLQASLENPDFQWLALKCWNGLVQNLPSNHLISLIDIVISLIFQKFETFENKSKEIAIDILKKIYDEIKVKHTKYSLYFLSIPFLSYIQDYKPISGFKNVKQISRLSIFQEFTRRLQTSNEYVVQHALYDLLNYCQKYQVNCQTEYFRDPVLEPYISELVRTLLDTASKFKNKNEKISTNCARVLSVIGSLDSNKFSFKTIRTQIILIQDFKDYKENCEFLIDFIENMVVKNFWASNDPVKQLFSAYAMQNFLQVMRLDSKVLAAGSQDYLVDVWNKFSDVSKSTLTPLLSSKYVAPPSRFEPISYPYFKMGMKYENWLVDFTSNLLKRPLTSIFEKSTHPWKQSIFQTCSKLIRDHDISLCQHLLKYVALSHIINGDAESTKDIKEEFLGILNTDSSSNFPDRVELLKNCFQTVFEVLDYFNAWVSNATQYLNNYQLEAAESGRIKKHIRFVNSFLENIPMDLIAVKSAECDSYERTILYLEKCFRDGQVDESFKLDDLNIVSTMQSMYSSINDYDALNGVLKKFSTNNLTEKLSTFQYNESWSLAQESFQILGKAGDDKSKVANNTKLLKSLNERGLYDEVLSALSSKSDFKDLLSIPLDWAMVGLQSSVFTGDLSQINKWLFVTNSIGKPQDVETLINYEFAKGIKFLFERKQDEFKRSVESMFKIIGTSLVPSVSSSFSRNTNLMNQLHALYDISLVTAPEADHDDIFRQENERILKERLRNIDQEFETQWKTLTLHSVANQTRLEKKKISKILLYCSSLAREKGRLDISTRSTIKAMVLNDQEANIEYAKLLWARDKQTEAIKSLADIIGDNQFKNSDSKAQVQLQYAKWLDESNHLSSQAIINEYNKTIKLNPSWEKPYYDLGVYYNKIMESTNDQSGYYERQTVRHFLKALSVGTLFIFEALPKCITIWLDFAQRKHRSRDAERNLNQIVEDIDTSLKNIPTHVWYTAITQILSRIVHEHKPSYDKLALIIVNIIKTYPRHSLWYILSHTSSNDSVRRERITNILKSVKAENSTYGLIIENAKELFNSLIKIASFKIPKSPRAKRLSLVKDFKVSNLSDPYDSLVIPVRSNLEMRLPAIQSSKFNAFPKSSSITFDGFDDNVNIFFSLQMPRQVTVRGSDNRPYRLMVKRDDTRKDAKVVEFTTMINRLLLASTEARKRSLQISNYSVVPLTENMGVIEFVTDVQTMKGITTEQRKRMGKTINERKMFMKLDEAQKELKSSKLSDLEPLRKLVDLYKDICEENPPVLHNWFIDQFSDPTAWYLARNCFIRSSAVMSIVGYIIGLGDRHCENILFFRRNGGVLHIDFDCLFDKGATLPTPEIVPFRLTQNMVDAMGICGIEGSFRITCEVTGSLLRAHEAPLMNILETLLYDPLLDWKSIQKPEVHLSKVRRKIRGLVNEKEGLAMNIHGQVDVLLQEASSPERLSQMYGGWSAYI